MAKNDVLNAHARFAAEHIAGRERLHDLIEFPPGLREQMAKSGLFGMGIDPAYGGKGGNSRDISTAGMALAEHGGNLGIALSFMMHELVARWFIGKFGTPDQKRAWLPELASGKMTACFAVSEPETGAHPKHLSTFARPDDDGYRLSGTKTYLTNGPMADLFIVIAVTKTDPGRKRFTAFLIPRETPGLTVADPMELPFLRPCPHGEISLEECPAGPGQVLGEMGSAFETMVLPLRTIEDTLMAGIFAGASAFQVQALARDIRTRQTGADDELLLALGRMCADVGVLKLIALSAAERIEQDGETEVVAATLSFRKLVQEFQDRLDALLETRQIRQNPEIKQMNADIAAAARIASRVTDIRLKKLGAALMLPPKGT